ncbi:hypothetical protein PVL29_019855 [Vitis rotundifolia]|uniref:BCD1 alpha/beta domain-containing protein n=1 Tax=Vitis rotundifolia TaxID=103349 RepID=A0AA38Z1R1_VITRO|nr:hypothetical protein PVL29_019855 [Vitis rotundifolia]
MPSTFHPWKNEKTHLQQPKILNTHLCVRSADLIYQSTHAYSLTYSYLQESFYNSLVNENSTLSSVIKNHLKPGLWNHKLKLFCAEQLDCLKFFIRKYLKGCRSHFHEFDIRAPIRQQLVNLVILEYPLIHVFLPSHSYDINVIKEAIKLRSSPHEKEPGENMDFDFDFDQGLFDVYIL